MFNYACVDIAIIQWDMATKIYEIGLLISECVI